jgi:hypothetical protein
VLAASGSIFTVGTRIGHYLQCPGVQDQDWHQVAAPVVLAEAAEAAAISENFSLKDETSSSSTGPSSFFEFLEETEKAAAVEFMADSRGDEGANVLGSNCAQVIGKFVGNADRELGHKHDPTRVGTIMPSS